MNGPRDSRGRFTKAENPWGETAREAINRVLKNRKVSGHIVQFHPSAKFEFIPIETKRRSFERVDSAASAHTGFGDLPKQKKNHDITMRAVLWATVGFLCGVIFEMIFQIQR